MVERGAALREVDNHLQEQADLRDAFFLEWRKLYPDVFTEDDWKYINIYYDTRDTDRRWDLLQMQDEGMLAAVEKFASHKFYHVLQYVYATRPSTADISVLQVFDLYRGEEQSALKLKVDGEIKYFWRGEEHSPDELQQEIDYLIQESVRLSHVLNCDEPVD